MTWRDPLGPRETVQVDCASIRELADTYHPFVRWTDDERFFPALAEAWLAHATSAPWPGGRTWDDDTEPPPETGQDHHRRGTGVCTADLDVTWVQVLAGAPNAHDTPLATDPSPGDPSSMVGFHGVDSTHFLDFGGWTADLLGSFQGRTGDLDYLYRAFSELAASINPSLDWEPVELMAHLPQSWVTQPPTPTVYCEARWASAFPGSAVGLDEPDFPPLPDPSPLDNLLVLTYHYLYPAREPSDGEPAVRHKEGQWEAVSLYFRGQAQERVFTEPPVGVVVSQGSDGGGADPMRSEFRPWAQVARTHAHPILFAARGSHRFFFEPIDGQTWDPGTGAPPVPDGGSYDENSEFPGWESWLVGGLLIAGFIALMNPLVGLVIAIIVLLFWLFTLIMDLCNDSADNPANPNPSNPEAGGDGPQGGDPEEAPAGGSSGGGGTPGEDDDVFGLPNSGSPTGRNTVSFDVRVIDRTRRGSPDVFTGYPSDRPCEDPTWWDYTGRWGVRVAPGLAGTWSSGDQRVDRFGRSWGYWHTLRFFEEILALA